MNYSKYRIVSLLFFIHSIAYGQTQVLKNYDFNKGGYYLIGIRSESGFNELAHSLGEFYTDDIMVLNAIKKEWTFTKPSPMYACGYHYEISICKNGLELESFAINLNCHVFATDKGYFYFNEQQLRVFKDSFKKPYAKQENFNSLIEARNYRAKILKEKSLIFTPTPNWVNYEGTFRFTYLCPKGTKDEKKMLLKLTNEIKAAYPDEKFELQYKGGSSTELIVEVKCNKSLESKFNLYKRHLDYDKWMPYDLSFTTYWTKNIHWYPLIINN